MNYNLHITQNVFGNMTLMRKDLELYNTLYIFNIYRAKKENEHIFLLIWKL